MLETAMGECSRIQLTEGVSVLEHSLWCAYQAWNEKCASSMVVAAMFHDIGHYICAGDPELTDFYKDKEHASLGAAWLSRWFPESVCIPIAMHIEAKRYLATTDIIYRHNLGHGSRQSLEHQGGLMNDDELLAFRTSRYADSSIKLRRFDDATFVKGAIPSYKWYETIIISILR